MATNNVEEQESSTSGRGIFAAKKLHTSCLVFQDREPLVAVLDSPLLTKTCGWCFSYSEEASQEDQLQPRACTGCKILRYCGKVKK